MKFRLMVFLSALVGAILLGGAGYFLGALIGSLMGGMFDLALGVAGMIVGTMLGNGLGAAWMAKRQGSQRKSWLFWAISLGMVIAILLLAEPLKLNQNTPILLITLLALPPLVQALVA
jgi:hypothetical protein